MKVKYIRIATYNDFGACKREDVNDLISSLVRMGYEVSYTDDYITFQIGNEDYIEERELNDR